MLFTLFFKKQGKKDKTKKLKQNQKMLKKIKFYQVIIFLFYLLFFVLLLKNSFSYLDPDLGWHLKMGEDISLEKKANYVNYYNFIFSENENYWLNHETLSDFLLFQAYSKFGYLFINIVFALIIILAIFLLNNFIVKNLSQNKNFLLFLLPIELIGLKASLPHLGVRIQELSVLFLVLLFLIIANFEKASLNNKKNCWKTLFWLIPLVCLWSNMHAGFLLGIALLFFYFGVKLVEKIISNYPKSGLYKLLNSFLSFKKVLSYKNLLIFLLFSVLAALSTLLNPYGFKLFHLLFEYKNTAYLRIITEWFPQHYYPFMYWQLLYMGIIAMILIVTIFSSNKSKNKILNLWNFSLTLLFIFLAFKSKRHFPLLFVTSLPLVAQFLFKDFGFLFEKKKKGGEGKNKVIVFVNTYLIICFLAVITLIFQTTKFTKNPFTSFCREYPCAAVSFIKSDPELNKLRLFNEYAWGGFLIHENPEQKIFIDGRQPQKPFKNHSYIEEYLLFHKENTGQVEEKIEEYNLELFLINANQTFKLSWLDKNLFGLKESDFKINTNFKEALEANENLEKIYEDQTSLIYKLYK